MTAHAASHAATLIVGFGRRALEPLLVLFACALLVATLGG